VRATSHQILARVPKAAVEALTDSAPSLCDPNHPMVGILRANAVALVRPAPASIGRLGGTAARVWRQRGIPACRHGPLPRGMAQADEHVESAESLPIVRRHVRSAFDDLSR
jgi:hypothetical protein